MASSSRRCREIWHQRVQSLMISHINYWTHSPDWTRKSWRNKFLATRSLTLQVLMFLKFRLEILQFQKMKKEERTLKDKCWRLIRTLAVKFRNWRTNWNRAQIRLWDLRIRTCLDDNSRISIWAMRLWRTRWWMCSSWRMKWMSKSLRESISANSWIKAPISRSSWESAHPTKF